MAFRIEFRLRDYGCCIEELVPIDGSSTAWAACSSPTGVRSQVFFSLVASGESSAVATDPLD